MEQEKCSCWHCVKVRAPEGEPIPAAGWRPLCKPSSLCVFSFLWRNYRHLRQKTCVCVCVMTQMETCRGAHSLQIKHSRFGQIAVQSVVQEGGIQIWSVFAVFIVTFLSPAVMHWLCVCVCVSRSNWVTSFRFCTLWSLWSYPACACFYQRDNCIRWCWEYDKIGNDRFSPFFTAVMEFPNYVITLSLLCPSRSDSTADFSVPVLFRISHEKRENFFSSVFENVH